MPDLSGGSENVGGGQNGFLKFVLPVMEDLLLVI
jgi:hypothetical protein